MNNLQPRVESPEVESKSEVPASNSDSEASEKFRRNLHVSWLYPSACDKILDETLLHASRSISHFISRYLDCFYWLRREVLYQKEKG